MGPSTIYIDEDWIDANVRTWEKTTELRIWVGPKGEEVLQQAYVCRQDGEVEWRAIPKVQHHFAE